MSLPDQRFPISLVYNGANWYTHNEQCCMATTDGSTTAMVGLSDRLGTFSLIPGGGLRIRLQKINNHWTSGVLTSVDNSGIGFSQQYGYFEIEAVCPSGYDTWPAFWMLNTAAKAHGALAGEVDIVEYIANPGFINYIRSTIHDWSDNFSTSLERQSGFAGTLRWYTTIHTVCYGPLRR